MMAMLGGCGDGRELPSDRIKKSGDFLRWHQTDPLAHFAEVRCTGPDGVGARPDFGPLNFLGEVRSDQGSFLVWC